jgi:hypothetical protein
MAALAPLLAIAFAFLVASAHAADPFAFFDWDVTYMTASPLGVPQKVRPASLSLSLSYGRSSPHFPFHFPFLPYLLLLASAASLPIPCSTNPIESKSNQNQIGTLKLYGGPKDLIFYLFLVDTEWYYAFLPPMILLGTAKIWSWGV